MWKFTVWVFTRRLPHWDAIKYVIPLGYEPTTLVKPLWSGRAAFLPVGLEFDTCELVVVIRVHVQLGSVSADLKPQVSLQRHIHALVFVHTSPGDEHIMSCADFSHWLYRHSIKGSRDFREAAAFSSDVRLQRTSSNNSSFVWRTKPSIYSLWDWDIMRECVVWKSEEEHWIKTVVLSLCRFLESNQEPPRGNHFYTVYR